MTAEIIMIVATGITLAVAILPGQRAMARKIDGMDSRITRLETQMGVLLQGLRIPVGASADEIAPTPPTPFG